MLGLFSFTIYGMQGGMIQQINHGLSSGALFLLVGMIYEQRHSRQIADFGGLWTQMPLYSRLFLVTVLASVGLPGLCGFVGEFLSLLGIAQKSLGVAFLAGTGVILAAIYLLWMFQRVFYGPVDQDGVRAMRDINTRELWCIVPLVVLMLWFGLAPMRFMAPAEPSMRWLQARLQPVDDQPSDRRVRTGADLAAPVLTKERYEAARRRQVKPAPAPAATRPGPQPAVTAADAAPAAHGAAAH
jgi:NADH-quinone oxidoreductase subunit M